MSLSHLPFSLICTCTFYTHMRYHPNLRKCHGLPWTLKWKCRVLLYYMETFSHGSVYTSSLNPVHITIEMYSMPKLNPTIFRTPLNHIQFSPTLQLDCWAFQFIILCINLIPAAPCVLWWEAACLKPVVVMITALDLLNFLLNVLFAWCHSSLS